MTNFEHIKPKKSNWCVANETCFYICFTNARTFDSYSDSTSLNRRRISKKQNSFITEFHDFFYILLDLVMCHSWSFFSWGVSFDGHNPNFLAWILFRFVKQLTSFFCPLDSYILTKMQHIIYTCFAHCCRCLVVCSHFSSVIFAIHYVNAINFFGGFHTSDEFSVILAMEIFRSHTWILSCFSLFSSVSFSLSFSLSHILRHTR